MSAPYQFLTVERTGGVEHVTLNRPDVRNAFNEHVIADLTAWARTAHQDPPRVVVFAGAGKVFSAGADAAWMAKMAGYTREDNVRDARAGAEMFLAINTVPAIVIGRIHGAALGGGGGLDSVCCENSPESAGYELIFANTDINQTTYTDDPVYLTEPLVKTTNMLLDTNSQPGPYQQWLFCQADDEVPGRDSAYVPHFLPGANPYLAEYATKYGMAVEAARGGAETQYPEYAPRMKPSAPAAGVTKRLVPESV